jgi:hypothetical protein
MTLSSFVVDLYGVSEASQPLTAQGFQMGLTYKLGDLSGRGLKKLNTKDIIR